MTNNQLTFADRERAARLFGTTSGYSQGNSPASASQLKSAQSNYLREQGNALGGRFTQSKIEEAQRYAKSMGLNFNPDSGYSKGTKPSSSPSSAQRSAQRKAKSAATGNAISKGGALGLAGAFGQYDTLEEKSLMAKMMFNPGSLTDADKRKLGMTELMPQGYDNVPSGGVFDMVAEGRDPSKKYYSDGTYAGQVLSGTLLSNHMISEGRDPSKKYYSDGTYAGQVLSGAFPSNIMGSQLGITSGFQEPSMVSPFNTGNFNKTQESIVGYRANGGPVEAGQPYVVGERGPELIYPSQDGNVLSNEMLQIAREFGIDPSGLSEDDLYQLLSAQAANQPDILARTPAVQAPAVQAPQGVSAPTQAVAAPAMDGSQIPQAGEEGFKFAERGSPQDYFLLQTNNGTTPLSPEKIARGQEYAKQQGLNFDPTTGFSQGTEAPQVQAPQVLTTAGGQPLAEFLAGGQQLDAQGRMIDPNVDRSVFERESAAREARQAARPDFFEAQTRAPGTVTDRERRAARGGGISDADRNDIAKANRPGASASAIARGDKVAALNGIDRRTGKSLVSPMTPSDILAREKWEDEKSKSGEPTTAEKNFLLAERKYNDILEKEKNGTPLTPADKLAREKFEYEQGRDAKSDAAGPDKSATERNIDTMMRANPDMSYTEAANIVQNVVSKTTDPLSGRTSVTNIAEGTSTPMQSTEPLASSVLNLKPKAAGEGLYARGANETGIIASLLRGGQKVTGQAGFDMASAESLEVKKELDAFQGSLSRAFQEGDRFSSSQDKILREELDVTLGAWKDPKTFQANMRSLDRVLRKRHSDLTDNYNDLTLDSDFRADSKSKAKVIEQALNDMGVTQDAKPTEGNTPPEGIKSEAAKYWRNMSEEDRALFLPQAK